MKRGRIGHAVVLATALALLSMLSARASADIPAEESRSASTSFWSVLAGYSDDSIITIDFGTSPPTVHGPFLSGQLGSGGLFGIKVTPDGHYALVCDFSDKLVFRVDVSNPAAPVLAGSVSVPLEPEAVAISPDGSFAMVTDGEATGGIAVIEMSSFTLKTTYYPPGSFEINGIAIAADNATWVAAEWGSMEIHYGTYSLFGGFSGIKSLGAGGYPISVTISPDGKTVLVPCLNPDSVSGFQITGPGVMAYKSSVSLPMYPQSGAFSPSSDQAYVLSYGVPAVSALSVTSPGILSLAQTTSLPWLSGCWFGAQCLVVTPDNASVILSDINSPEVELMSTSTYGLTPLSTGATLTVGVAIVGSGTPSSYDLSFLDDLGRTKLCVNSTTGSYSWTILKGTGADTNYTGTGQVTNTATQFTLSSAPGTPRNIFFNYFKSPKTASGYCLCGTQYSCLVDANTANDPACQ